MSDNVRHVRIDLLDAWRSLAVVCMVIYHFLYDLMLFGLMSPETMFSPGLNAFQKFICCSFILLSGMSSRFSRNNIRRGLITLGAGFLVIAGSFVAGVPILFGILQFLGCAMLLYGLIGNRFEQLPTVLQPVLCIVLYIATDIWTSRVMVSVPWLYPLGFLYPGFSSSDFFPILPWIFLFLLGAWLGGVLPSPGTEGSASRLYTKLPAWTTWIGRHSLLVYLLHQPILYGLSMLMFRAI